ncbi:hypothetical protein BZA77DRAFT_57504 [Pyronema omphalodes]|nr:hypothetical protein BZA77DRAFT_57504 [Pyronema omphalodes]
MPRVPTKVVQPTESDEEDDFDYEDFSEDDSPGVWRPLNKLGEMHWHRRCISDLYEMMNTPWLDLNPDYQRGVIWGPERMSKLIHSLMAGYYVPPLIFNVKRVTGDDGIVRFQRISIDGKQRLSSIRSFVEGDIPCLDSKNRKWWYADSPNARGKRNLLPEKARRDFLKTELLCAEYSDLDRVQEEEMFSRVQLGVPLTPAEKLRATTGPWQMFATELQKKFSDLITGVIDDKRAKGFQLILSVFYQIVYPNSGCVYGATQLGKFCKNVTLTPELHEIVTGVFKRYQEVYHEFPHTFEDQEYAHCRKYSPLEFLGMTVLIHRYPTHTIKELSRDILTVRKMLRECNKELRMNSSTWKSFMDTLAKYDASQAALHNQSQRQRSANLFGSAAEGSVALGINTASSPAGPADVSTIDANGYSTQSPTVNTSWNPGNSAFNLSSLRPFSHSGSGSPISPYFTPQQQFPQPTTQETHQLSTPTMPSAMRIAPPAPMAQVAPVPPMDPSASPALSSNQKFPSRSKSGSTKAPATKRLQNPGPKPVIKREKNP